MTSRASIRPVFELGPKGAGFPGGAEDPLAALAAEALLFSDPGDGSYAGGQVPPDTSGNHSDGQLGSTAGVDANDPTFASGIWSFDAASSQYISWPDSDDWNVPSAAAGGEHTRIIVCRMASSQPNFTRVLESGDEAAGTCTIWVSGTTFTFRINDGTTDKLTSIAGATGTTWQVITVRTDDTTMYIRNNGSSNSTTRGTGAVETTNPLTIARNSRASGQYFTGDVKLAAVWGRKLTDTEVALIESSYG